MAEKDSSYPRPADSGAKGKGKQPESVAPTPASGPDGRNQQDPAPISGAASRIADSARGLMGDLLAPNSTTEALASSTAQSKAGRFQSSSAGASGLQADKQSEHSDRSVNRPNGGLGNFRQPPSSGEYASHGSTQVLEVEQAGFEAYRPDAAGLVAGNELTTPASNTYSSAGQAAKLSEAQEFDAEKFRQEYLSRDFVPQPSQSLKTDAEAEAATWIAQFHDTATDERSYYKNVMRHARGHSAASERGIHQEDGDEVVRLLDMGIPINYGEDDGLTSFSESISGPGHTMNQAAEPEVTADDLFGIEEEHVPVARDNPINLQPDFSALNPRVDPVTGETLGEEQTMRDVLDRMSLLDQWGEVLDSYTDSVWGPEQLSRAREAKEQLQKAREEEASTATPEESNERPALRRLRDLMGQLQVNTKDPRNS